MKIEVCHVEKSLKGREVLKDISCVMESGKICKTEESALWVIQKEPRQLFVQNFPPRQ